MTEIFVVLIFAAANLPVKTAKFCTMPNFPTLQYTPTQVLRSLVVIYQSHPHAHVQVL